MSFEYREADCGQVDIGAEVSAVDAPPRAVPLDALRSTLPDVTPALVEQLARQLALVNGEDPDEQPRPLRFPRWRFHRSRAKALLTIGPMELRALAKVLQVGGAHEPWTETDSIRVQ